jgi:hypothetical protein
MYLKLKGKNRHSTRWFLLVMTSLLFGVASILLVRGISPQFWIVSSLVLAVALGKLIVSDVTRFSNVYVFMTVCLLYLAVTFMGWQSEIETNRVLNLIFFVGFCVAFAMFKNRSRLDYLVSRRSQGLDSLPKGIYKYNRKLTLILCVIGVPFVVFAKKLGSSIYGIFLALLNGVVLFVKWFSSLFKSDTVNTEETYTPTDTTPYVQDRSEIFNDVATVVVVGLLVFIIYYYHEDIIRGVRDLFRDLKRQLSSLVGKSKQSEDVLTMPSNDGYTDYVSEVKSVRFSKRTFRKDYRHYLKLENSSETFRFGYSVLIYGLNVLGYEIQPFESVTEISSRLEVVDSNELLKVYLSVRYGESLPTVEDREVLNSVLKAVSKQM